VREKALWRLLYESAARAQEVLSLNVEDLDLENKRARVRSKGGDIEWLHLQSGSARLLPKLIAGRPRGPLFLADRRPAPARMPAAVDVCPVTGRGRLSYRRAEELFHAASGGWTLHQLRHSAITHLAEADVGLALLMAKSRHTSLRSLQRYARPGPEAVAKLTAEHDPARRRPSANNLPASLRLGELLGGTPLASRPIQQDRQRFMLRRAALMPVPARTAGAARSGRRTGPSAASGE